MKFTLPFLLIALLTTAAFAQQQQQKTSEKVGLAAALADDEKVISELSKRGLTTLRDYMFSKDGISKQQQDLIYNVARGIDKVLATMNDPSELMRLNASLVVNGTARHVNVLEYFGDSPKVQSQLRPIAEAIDRVYDKAIVQAQKKADDIANQMTPQNQN